MITARFRGDNGGILFIKGCVYEVEVEAGKDKFILFSKGCRIPYVYSSFERILMDWEFLIDMKKLRDRSAKDDEMDKTTVLSS